MFENIRTETYLKNIKALSGKPGSGNFAMFYAINQIHKKLYLNKNSDSNINIGLNYIRRIWIKMVYGQQKNHVIYDFKMDITNMRYELSW